MGNIFLSNPTKNDDEETVVYQSRTGKKSAQTKIIAYGLEDACGRNRIRTASHCLQ
jgi:hypothetical protein